MDDSQLREALVGNSWVRISGQLGVGEVRFQKVAGELPPRRGGHEQLQFEDGQKFTLRVPGPDDRPRSVAGTWRVSNGEITLRFDHDTLLLGHVVIERDTLHVRLSRQ